MPSASDSAYPRLKSNPDTYDGSAARARHMTVVRNFVGVTAYGYAARKIVVDASLQAARPRDDLPDIINVALEELARPALRASRLQHTVEGENSRNGNL